MTATPTTPLIASLIEDLRAELRHHYNSDFAFTILGRGHILAAANYVHGEVRALPIMDQPQTTAKAGSR